MRIVWLLAAWGALAVPLAQQVPSTVHPLHRPFDRLLDTYVRDGFVYYGALRLERRPLDAYVASLDSRDAAALAGGSLDDRKAFWINAYNALVLRTVIDHYPIRARYREYPPQSIRQIPGAFEAARHRVAGRVVSLDGIEKEILGPMGDPRVFFALGRGAYGGGRLRSEAFDGPTVEKTLAAVAQESALRHTIAHIDRGAQLLSVSPIFSWREPFFVEAYAERAPSRYAARSPIERAILAFVEPHLPPAEQQVLQENRFRVQFHEFDWRLNDLGQR